MAGPRRVSSALGASLVDAAARAAVLAGAPRRAVGAVPRVATSATPSARGGRPQPTAATAPAATPPAARRGDDGAAEAPPPPLSGTACCRGAPPLLVLRAPAPERASMPCRTTGCPMWLVGFHGGRPAALSAAVALPWSCGC
ncbi:unnamed protein product [Prorocentrum cordatum]|uniref:Uncharacterized protein n=1 Tax=Prorocentrum cordatum TaxID=2364126 RepID=A0ABN9T3E0_9DINO|nr:unnamed protein product [Polarella glacialis]